MVPVVEAPAAVCDSWPPTLAAALHEFRGHILASKSRPMLAGSIERRIQERGKEVLLAAAREAFQAQADAVPPRCPKCGGPLRNVEKTERTVMTQWGEVTIRRDYGRCPKRQERVAPADVALGLEPHEQTSPDLAEKLSWLATQMPPTQAAEVFEHLTGQGVSPSRVERQAKKKGTQALAEREEERRRALSTSERFEFSRENKPEGEPEEFTLVIVPDAWMMRERDGWGKSEAMRMGLARAKDVLIIADGGVWIWRLAADRFPWAKGTLDFYHAGQHLWAVARALFGADEDRARRWVEPVLHQLRHGEHGKVLGKLRGLSRKHAHEEFAATLRREWEYFESHKDHLDYQAKAERGEPIGSGAVESLCKQYQIRFKRSGQFWLTENAERLLELDNRRRNNRWDSLWPH